MILVEMERLSKASASQAKSIELRQVASKIKSLNILFQNLMQKKLRIDLELKRTKVKISSLRKMTQTNLKSSLQLETHSLPITRSQLQSLCEELNLEFQDIVDLDELLDEAVALEKEFETDYAPYIIET